VTPSNLVGLYAEIAIGGARLVKKILRALAVAELVADEQHPAVVALAVRKPRVLAGPRPAPVAAQRRGHRYSLGARSAWPLDRPGPAQLRRAVKSRRRMVRAAPQV
jgi:hypothetical protein